ncbi:1-acyl-sn-glycerol-3-phosphate acyltransferase PLS1-like [Apium graveolens]|uniref:1-acyl-sn-glycerol-3-phosphate acyltransferase PLS1-like n=1 Tax=Apium graveolens TaxID=4045 RepID=UPI003D79E987
MKKSSKFLPVIGRSMWFSEYIFLEWSWAQMEIRFRSGCVMLHSRKIQENGSKPRWFRRESNYQVAWTFGAVDPTAAQQLYFRSCRVYAGSFIKVADKLRKLQKKG